MEKEIEYLHDQIYGTRENLQLIEQLHRLSN